MNDSVATTQIFDCMSAALFTINKYSTLAQAYEVMITQHIRRIPVVDGDRLLGILAMTDILRFKPAEIRRYLSFKELSETLDKIIVELVMTPDPIVVYQTDQVGYAAELMQKNKIGGLPVVNAERLLVGLITESDIFGLLAKHWRDGNAAR